MALATPTAPEADRYRSIVQFRVLGQLEHGDPESPTALGTPRQRAVLAILLRAGGGLVTDDALIDGVWGEEPPGSVRASIHTYISNLRACLGGGIERQGSGYRLDVDPSQIDAVAFEQAIDTAATSASTNPEQTAASLRTALAMWRGRPYADLIDLPGLQDEIRRLEELRLRAVELRIDADLSLGRHAQVVSELEALATEHPLREGFRARHMLALYRDGRQSEALRAMQRTRDHLSEELGVEPSPELVELEERILQHDPELMSDRDVRTEHVAFLFTDVEASTALWETRPEQMRDALTTHDRIISSLVADAGGRVFKHTGDGLLGAFPDALSAARVAAEAQRRFATTDWGPLGDFGVKMSVDIGEVDARGGDYFGPPLNRAARLVAAAHGGQVVLSESAQEAVRREPGLELRTLGEYRLKGLGAPQQVYQLLVDGIPNDFQDLRTDTSTPQEGRQFGDAIRGYEIRERIGVGRFGVVYRAYQPSVGREVAVKVIRPEFANHPTFVRRFESEARLVAKLSHPHIVPLFDYWRDHEGAYLVMPHMAGRSLAEVEGTLPVQRVVAIIRQVGAALAYAHRHGVIHRDVKPANLLVDGEGNTYLGDFGIAVRALEQASGLRPTSLTYRSPEDTGGGTVDERSDIFSLAAVARRLLSGSEDDPRPIDAPVAEVLERALSIQPELRQSTVDQFVADMAAASGLEADVPATPVVVRNPFKGLAPFDEDDARDFFGRDIEIDRLIHLVEHHRFVCVVGPSGCGKSSLVRAGLLPALRSGRIAGSSSWLAVTMLPGAHPFDELATALGDVAIEPLNELASELRSDDHGFLRISKWMMRDLDGDLVVVIDQFEELWSLVDDDETRSRFITAILEATEDPHSRIRVVVTMRADFFDRPLSDDRLGRHVSNSNLALVVPGPDDLLDAIRRPAAAAGIRFDDGVAQRIVADVEDEPGGLPLMQFVLTELVDRAEEGGVTLALYRDSGGVTAALSRRASEVHRSLSASDRRVSEQVFLRLVTVSDDADDVRRRVRRSELESLGFDAGSVDRVLAAFGSARLLTFDHDPITRGPTVEVAHEALIREWDLLRSWVDGRRDSLLTHRRLRQALGEWESAGEPDDLLPIGGRLHQFEEWAARDGGLDSRESAFLTRAVEQRTAAERSKRTRRRSIMAGFAAATAVSLALAVLAFLQFSEADVQRAAAEARGLVAEARGLVSIDPELAIHLGLEAHALFEGAGEPTGAAVQAIRTALANVRVVSRFDGGSFVAVSPDGQSIANADGSDVVIRHRETGEVIHRLHRSDDAVATSAAYSSDGSSLVATYSSPEGVERFIRVWDLDDGSHRDVGGVNADPNWRHLVMPAPGEIIVETWESGSEGIIFGLEWWSIADGELLDERRPAGGIDVGLDGGQSWWECDALAQCSLVIDDWPSGARQLPSPLDVPLFTAMSPDRSLIAVADQSTAVVLDAVSGVEVARTDVDRVFRPVWLDDHTFLVGGESAPRVINARTGRVVMELRGLVGSTWSYAPIPGTGLVAAASLTGNETVVFDVSELGSTEIAGWLTGLDGAYAASVSSDGTHVNVVDGGTFLDFGPHEYFSGSLGSGDSLHITGAEVHDLPWMAPNGDVVAIADADGQWSIRATTDGTAIYRAQAGQTIIGVSPDLSRAVTREGACAPGDRQSSTIITRLESIPDGDDVAVLDAGCADLASFSPDGRLISIPNNREPWLPDVGVFSTADGARIASIDGFPSVVTQFAPDGTLLAVGGFGPIRFYDVEGLVSGAPSNDALVPPGIESATDSLAVGMAFAPDSSAIASITWNEPAKVWDVRTGALLHEFGSPDPSDLIVAAFDPTQPHIAVASGSVVRVHTLDSAELLSIAESRLTREMTNGECLTYFLMDCDAWVERRR